MMSGKTWGEIRFTSGSLQNKKPISQPTWSNNAYISLLIPLIIGLVCGGVIAWLLAKIYYLEHRSRDRKLSVKQSAATTLGYVSEKVAPLLPQFPYTHKDLVFLGKGVDYICFDGLSQGRVRQIIFLEIKTGKSTLNANEQRIKDAIDKGRVSWETLRIGVGGEG